MAGVYAPLSGTIARSGRVTPLLSIGMGLQPEATGHENIILLGMHLDIPPREMRTRVDEIVDWTELGAFIEAPLKTYSAGMVVRLAFAVSTCFRPEILLMDEWFGVADASFQAKAYERMASFIGGSSVLVLASHSADLLERWCNKAVRLDGGRIVERGEVRALVPRPEPGPIHDG
jgi:ABC-2 type transport system ATP-binding protein/lipopolysaccharide transport system ATP-binding protein